MHSSACRSYSFIKNYLHYHGTSYWKQFLLLFKSLHQYISVQEYILCQGQKIIIIPKRWISVTNGEFVESTGLILITQFYRLSPFRYNVGSNKCLLFEQATLRKMIRGFLRYKSCCSVDILTVVVVSSWSLNVTKINQKI